MNQEIVQLILAKENPTQEEIIFLEKVYSSNAIPDSNLGNFIGNWYIKNGNPVKGASYLNGNSENPLENITGGIIPTNPETTVTPENLETQNYTQYLTFLKMERKILKRKLYRSCNIF